MTKINQEVYYGDKKKVFCAEDYVGNYHGPDKETKKHEAAEKEGSYSYKESLEQN